MTRKGDGVWITNLVLTTMLAVALMACDDGQYCYDKVEHRETTAGNCHPGFDNKHFEWRSRQ
jgi:hypothetical protein